MISTVIYIPHGFYTNPECRKWHTQRLLKRKGKAMKDFRGALKDLINEHSMRGSDE